jgi:hypothetical protein
MIEEARQGVVVYYNTDEQLQAFFQRFEALVRADERKNRSHSLGPGEMELSLRREHNGELFEYRYRFTKMQILHQPVQNLVEGTAGRLAAEITHAIRARGAHDL